MSKLIADISKHQWTVNFNTMKKAGVDGVIIRAGYRTAKSGENAADPNFSTNINGAIKAGLPVGVYWWTTSKSNYEAEAEAAYCAKLIKGYKISFPVWLDIEYYNSSREGRADHLTKEKRTQYAIAFLEKVKSYGYDVGVYCNKDFWNDSLQKEKLQHYARWIAHYGKSNSVDCDMWQYTSSAKGNKYGVSSSCIDLSYCYTDFIFGKKSKFADGSYHSAQSEVKDMDTLRKGDKGQQVRALQKLLGNLTVDGIFGVDTQNSVKAYQRKNNLEADGIVGPKTWEKILSK